MVSTSFMLGLNVIRHVSATPLKLESTVCILNWRSFALVVANMTSGRSNVNGRFIPAPDEFALQSFLR